MTRGQGILAAVVVLGSAACLQGTALAQQQQWGPPAQSRYYHNPGNPPTYMAYNTEVPRTTPKAAAPQTTIARSTATQTTAVRRPVGRTTTVAGTKTRTTSARYATRTTSQAQ